VALFQQFHQSLTDIDPIETQEWIESLESVVECIDRQRAEFLIYRLLSRARQLGVSIPHTTHTPYLNTIPRSLEPEFPGDEEIERRIRRLIRWNAAVMVTRANNKYDGLGGHLSSYASSASLYEVGFNHFFRGKDGNQLGDQIFYQGHAAPGMYARAFLEGRFSQKDLDFFRRESGQKGLSSYPHPRLMPDFWEFPTVSMGLGPINAIYQARFNRYLSNRGIADTKHSRVWAFLGDGETDEPESLGALSLAGRERLDNLIFVVNCNLQRLDGPVRGNGKIIQELESVFRGAGWNVIKVIWGREWDDLFRRDTHGLLLKRMSEIPDGDFQRFPTMSGANLRQFVFGKYPRLLQLVEHLSDEQLRRLRRGGHDYTKIYAAYKMAEESDRPTAILCKTVKGWTLGEGFEARNVTHQIKKLKERELKVFRDRLELPIPDSKLKEAPYYHPGKDSKEVKYMLERRRVLGGALPKRRILHQGCDIPPAKTYTDFHAGTKAGQSASTTMVCVRLLSNLLKTPDFGKRIVPIVSDEARTFGMEPLFREIKIYSSTGQTYTPVDAGVLMSYKEAKDGQLLQEGITEAGALASFTASATSYSSHREVTIPFFIFYSMFGFQRVGDLIWAMADARGRGFLLGATAGRTTLSGEGLQHQDGHSLLNASTVPSCRAYDPAFAYEIAVIIEEGIRRMYVENEDIFYYLTLYNENYEMPAMPEKVKEGILRGIYLFKPAPKEGKARAQLLGSGPIMQQSLRAQQILSEKFDVAADVWSVTSYGELRRDALEVETWNRKHPESKERAPFIAQALNGTEGPIVAASDYMKAMPDLIRPWLDRPLVSLGTDGFGRSDTREALRRYFEIDAETIVVSTLSRLVRSGKIGAEKYHQAVKDFGIEIDEPAFSRDKKG
jgi:pyruvate dehydrogenase E1 component